MSVTAPGAQDEARPPATAPRVRLTGGEAAVRALQSVGVRTIFGIPSVHNLPIVDALGRLGAPALVGTRHEQGAGAMADAYARASGRLGAFLTSTGPGACNSVSAMYEADFSFSPVLQVTAQMPSALVDRPQGTPHEMRDQPAMLRAVSKGVLRARTTEEIPGVVRAAANLALTPPTGPAAVEIPIDLQYAEAEFEIPEDGLVPARPAPDPADAAAAARLLHDARRVVIWAGGGAVRSGATAAVTALAERLGAAVITSTNGRGAIDEAHPLCVGAFGGDPEVRAYMRSADVWLGLGTRFRNEGMGQWDVAPPGAVVSVNADPAERDHHFPSTVFLPADVRLACEALLAALGSGARAPDPAIAPLATGARERVLAQLGPWRPVVGLIEEILPADAIVVRDELVAATAFGHRLVRLHRPGASIYPAGRAIGLGLPFALGAKTACPERPVVAMIGDGGFMLNMGELATAVQHRIAAVLLVFNDRGYGVLRKNQDLRFEGRRMAVDLHAPDFGRLAEAFGMRHMHVASLPEFGTSLRDALGAGEPVLVEVDTGAIGPLPRIV